MAKEIRGDPKKIGLATLTVAFRGNMDRKILDQNKMSVTEYHSNSTVLLI